MDVGPRAVAYRWILSGGDAFLGYGEELRIARLDGTRARVAEAGWSDGACGGSRVLSPPERSAASSSTTTTTTATQASA